MGTQTDSEMTPARAAMDRLGVSDWDVVRGAGLSIATVRKIVSGDKVMDTSLAKYLTFSGFTDDEREAIRASIELVVVHSATGHASIRTANPDSVGWAAVERMEVRTTTLAEATGLPRRTIYKVLNGARVGIGSLAKFLGYHRLTDAERIALIDAHGYVPQVVMGRLVGLSDGEGQPMTTIVRGHG